MRKQANIYDIRYVKLHFTLRMIEDTVMPTYKASALRGGMGEMLLRSNCIGNRDCDTCGFEGECVVRRIMYSRMEIQPEFMSAGDSVGYVIECEDYREEFKEGDEWKFNLILFGKNIVYFSQYLNALYALGMNGIGKGHGKFQIASVTNTKGRELMHGGNIAMSEYRVESIADYIAYRKEQAARTSLTGEIRFKSPLAVKYRGEMMDAFAVEPIFEAIKRRVYMLDCFEGIESDIMEYTPELPTLTGENHRGISVRRYSNHKDSAMTMRGIEGGMFLESIPEEIMDLLFAGELIHIGKNTSFGFGRYRVK